MGWSNFLNPIKTIFFGQKGIELSDDEENIESQISESSDNKQIFKEWDIKEKDINLLLKINQSQEEEIKRKLNSLFKKIPVSAEIPVSSKYFFLNIAYMHIFSS